MSETAPTDDPPPYDGPPAYDEPEADDVNKTLDPHILILSGQSIHAESADAAPLYELSRGVAKLGYATPEVSLRRVDRVVRTDANDEPAIRHRSRPIYDLKNAKAVHAAISSELPPLFVKSVYRGGLGTFAFDKSRLRSRWKALPLDTNKNRPSIFVKDAKPLFEVRHKNGTYEWTDGNGNAVAVEDGGEETHRLLVTAELMRETVDALVALWCCRLWMFSADNEGSVYSGMENCKNASLPFPLAVLSSSGVLLMSSVVHRRMALARELPGGSRTSRIYLQ